MPAWQAGCETVAVLQELFRWDRRVRQAVFDAVEGLDAEQLHRPLGFGPGSLFVAREHRVPAMMGAVDATRRFHDGQRVTVDGHLGVVLPLP